MFITSTSFLFYIENYVIHLCNNLNQKVMGHFRNIKIDNITGKATLAREHSKMETVVITEKNSKFTSLISKSLTSLPMGEVIDYLNYVAEKKNLKLNRESEYREAQFELMEIIKRN
jgi:hypothetical protein